MAEYKLNIFDVLKNITSNNRLYYTSLEPEMQKAFQPILTQRWLTGSNNPRNIVFLSHFANKYIFNLYKHPNLLYKLLVVCSDKRNEKFNWVPVSKDKTNTGAIDIIMQYYGYSKRKAQDVVSLFNKEQLVNMATQLGYQTDELKKLKRVLK